MSWRLAPALDTFRGQINAKFPLRDKRSDGTIGDAAHSARKSDHNPNAAGVVCAFDLDEDIAPGVDLKGLVAHLVAVKDPRINYLIYEGKIYGRTQFAPRTYTGPNAHEHHLHISIRQDATYWDDASPFDLGDFGNAAPVAAPVLKPVEPVAPATPPAPNAPAKGYAALKVDGDRGPVTVKAWQILLKAVGHYAGAIDGAWGRVSVRAEQRWLKSLGRYMGAVDGFEGYVTIKALQGFLRAKGHYRGLLDGRRGPLTVKAEQSYLNDQRKFL